jgi:hypothetical protein
MLALAMGSWTEAAAGGGPPSVEEPVSTGLRNTVDGALLMGIGGCATVLAGGSRCAVALDERTPANVVG